jgi:hypothetical protein
VARNKCLLFVGVFRGTAVDSIPLSEEPVIKVIVDDYVRQALTECTSITPAKDGQCCTPAQLNPGRRVVPATLLGSGTLLYDAATNLRSICVRIGRHFEVVELESLKAKLVADESRFLPSQHMHYSEVLLFKDSICGTEEIYRATGFQDHSKSPESRTQRRYAEQPVEKWRRLSGPGNSLRALD